jgi:CheY-like chemotaxis protein
MEKHGGYVRAESPGVGQGAEFVLSIPLCEGAELPGDAAAPADQMAAATPRKVLLVEDHADNAETLSRLLERAGHEVTVVASGHDALAVVPELKPEVVLLDLGLPGLDGYGVAEALRKSENGDGALIAAISGYGQERDKERSRAAGIDLHFVKPVDLATLLAAIDKKGSDASSA